MGKIRVDDHKDLGRGVSKSFGYRLGEAAIVTADENIEIWFCLFHLINNRNGGIGGTVIHYQDLPVECIIPEYVIHFANNIPDISFFVVGGNDNRKVVHSRRDPDGYSEEKR